MLTEKLAAFLQKILKMEKENGRELMGSLHGFNFRCTSEGHINIDIRELSPGWELLPQKQMPEAQVCFIASFLCPTTTLN